MARILLVEDNRELARSVAYNLELEQYKVDVVHDGPAALDAARAVPPDLILLDLMLPGIDGFTVLQTLRDEGYDGPVLILTARGEEGDKVRGFRAGADQYVTKPFGLLELLERIRLLLRRRAPAARRRNGLIRFGDVELDVPARLVRKRGRTVSLTPKAFDLLVALHGLEGTVATRLELMRRVWGHQSAVMSRTVDAHIAELRRKLEDDPAHPRHVVTVWKVGYRLEL